MYTLPALSRTHTRLHMCLCLRCVCNATARGWRREAKNRQDEKGQSWASVRERVDRVDDKIDRDPANFAILFVLHFLSSCELFALSLQKRRRAHIIEVQPVQVGTGRAAAALQPTPTSSSSCRERGAVRRTADDVDWDGDPKKVHSSRYCRRSFHASRSLADRDTQLTWCVMVKQWCLG